MLGASAQRQRPVACGAEDQAVLPNRKGPGVPGSIDSYVARRNPQPGHAAGIDMERSPLDPPLSILRRAGRVLLAVSIEPPDAAGPVCVEDNDCGRPVGLGRREPASDE